MPFNRRGLATVWNVCGASLFSPRLSPNGRYISALTSGMAKLMLFDTNTNRWSSLVEGEQVGYNEWSHDGEYVYMRENRGGAAELVRVRIKDRVLHPSSTGPSRSYHISCWP